MGIKPCLKKGNVCLTFVGLMIGVMLSYWVELFLGPANGITILLKTPEAKVLAAITGSFLGHWISRDKF